jgi:hypothetical protein
MVIRRSGGEAEIQATNQETKGVYKPTTSAAGVYVIAQLLAGTYELTSASLQSGLFVQKDVKVTAAGTLQLNLHFQDLQLNTNSPHAGWKAGPFRSLVSPKNRRSRKTGNESMGRDDRKRARGEQSQRLATGAPPADGGAAQRRGHTRDFDDDLRTRF